MEYTPEQKLDQRVAAQQYCEQRLKAEKQHNSPYKATMRATERKLWDHWKSLMEGGR